MQPAVQARQPMHLLRAMAMPQRRSLRVFWRARFRSSRMISRMSSRVSNSSGLLSRNGLEKAGTVAHQIEERNQRHRGDQDQHFEDRRGVLPPRRNVVGTKDGPLEPPRHKVAPGLELGGQDQEAREDHPPGTADEQRQEERHNDGKEDSVEKAVEEGEAEDLPTRSVPRQADHQAPKVGDERQPQTDLQEGRKEGRNMRAAFTPLLPL